MGDPTRDYDSFVMADIPGLIEGAAQGVGLGHEFLRHVERTRLLLHLIDGANVERDPWDEFEAINKELAGYSADLAARPQIIVLTKMDLPEARDRWLALQARAEAEGYAARAISSATQEGIQELVNYTAARLRELREDEAARVATEVPATGPVLRPQPDDAWFVEPGDEGVYYVRGRRVERMAAMTNPDSFEGMERLGDAVAQDGRDRRAERGRREAGRHRLHRQDTARMGRRDVAQDHGSSTACGPLVIGLSPSAR